MHDDPHSKIDALIERQQQYTEPVEEKKNISVVPSGDLQRVERNLRFTKKLLSNPLKKNIHVKKIFGVYSFDPAVSVFGNNVWDRGIYVVDELCDMYVSGTLEQMQKYIAKKRKVSSKLMFILLVMGLGGLAVVFMLLLFTMGGGM